MTKNLSSILVHITFSRYDRGSMKYLNDALGASKWRRRKRRLVSGIRWLTDTAGAHSETEHRRAHLLAWILLNLILLSVIALFLVLLVDPPHSERRGVYVSLILLLTLLVTLAYHLNRVGHYSIAAGLTVASATLGPWGSLAFDANILRGDFIPLTYVALTILLSSMLLSPAVTVALAALQLGGLWLAPVFIPSAAQINWPSLVLMVFFATVLSVVISTIHQRDIQLIERQARRLAHANHLISSFAEITTRMERALSQEQILTTLFAQLQTMDLACIIALQHRERKSFTIHYTPADTKAPEQIESEMELAALVPAFSPDSWKGSSKDENPFPLAAAAKPEVEAQWFLPQPGAAHLAESLQAIADQPGVDLLRLPLAFEDQLWGILWIWGKDISEDDLPILSAFAKQVGTSLDRAYLYQEVQSLALTDPLTGLQNRRGLFEWGKIEFARAQRTKRPLCCMMLDLDHFKGINDDYGHAVGDQVLLEVAARCRRSVREADLVCRYGGEEILILLPESDLEQGIRVADRLRKTIVEAPVLVSGLELNVTVSIGVSTNDKNTPQLETLIARADQAMYIAKYQGRNRVAISI